MRKKYVLAVVAMVLVVGGIGIGRYSSGYGIDEEEEGIR